MMDGNELTLDEIMSDAPASEVVEKPVETPEKVEQPRSENGQFATKAEETPTPTDEEAQAAVEGGDKGKVPIAAVQAEREKRKQVEGEAETLRRELAELRGQVSVLTQQRQQPAPAKEQAKPKNFWENPDEFLSERLAPVQQTVQQQRYEMSRMLADEKFGADVVKAADDELGKLMQANDPSVAALQAQIANSRHPFADLVAWHQRRQALADIGDDPKAYQDRERERIRAELLAEFGIEAAPAEPAATPSTPAKPLTKLPQSLSKLPGGGNSAGEVDVSDAGLFKHALGG